jgi:AAA family ATP:ADP antiporter
MIRERFAKLKSEVRGFTKKERLFLLCQVICLFLISAEYAIIRPVSNSLFLFFHTSALFPYAWLAGVPLNFLIVSLYNRYLPRIGCLRMFLLTVALIMGGNLFCAFFLNTMPLLSFIFYLWKEIYILLMFQHVWSLIHSHPVAGRAKLFYGIIYGVGGLGGIFGSLVPGFLAVKMGSESLLFLTLPLYLVLVGVFLLALKNSSEVEVQITPKPSESLFHGVKLITRSRLLLFIAAIVILMQFSSTLIDFQFSRVLEQEIVDKDLRTEFLGRILGMMQCATVFMQFIGTMLLVHFLGLRGSHLLLPLTLALNGALSLIFPAFGMAAFSYVTVKTYDFSLFGVIKEMLYVPLSVDEKFRAKSVIDVFAYRTSKALASFLILFCQAFAGLQLLTYLGWGSLAVFGLWVLLVLKMLPKPEPTQAPTLN